VDLDGNILETLDGPGKRALSAESGACLVRVLTVLRKRVILGVDALLPDERLTA
jgi:hypothetical protein